jgi:hypothetical protein
VAKSQYDGISLRRGVLCAQKVSEKRAHKASIDTDALHITALLPFLGTRPLRQIIECH